MARGDGGEGDLLRARLHEERLVQEGEERLPRGVIIGGDCLREREARDPVGGPMTDETICLKGGIDRCL